MKKKCVIILLISQLTSCTSYQEDFECKAESGIGCKSISEVNEMVNRGQFANKLPENIMSEEIINSKNKENNFLTYHVTSTSAENKVQRIPEKTARIWIKSFVDEKGDYVGETYVHTVIAPGTWGEVTG